MKRGWLKLLIAALMVFLLFAPLLPTHAGDEKTPCPSCNDTTKGWVYVPYQSGARLYHKRHCKNCLYVVLEEDCERVGVFSCTDLYCGKCNALVVEASPPNFVSYETIEPTCVNDGVFRGLCEASFHRAHWITLEVFPALGHQPRITLGSPATCTAP